MMVRFSMKGEDKMSRRKFRYCRVSRPSQQISRQVISGLKQHSDFIVIQEVHTRTTFQGRKEWDKLMRTVQKGDLISFESISRMSGNADEGCEAHEHLFNKGVDLEFDKEPHINTEAFRRALKNRIQIELSTGNKATDTLISTIIEALNQYTMEIAKQQIRIAFEQSEKEVLDIRQRTREGIETARLNGKQIGHKVGTKLVTKKSIVAKEIIRKRSKDFEGQLPDADVMLLAGVSHNTYYKYKKELTQEQICVKN